LDEQAVGYWKGVRSMTQEVEVGTVTDFFSRPVVAGIDLKETLKRGEKIHIKGHTTDLELVVESMQIHNQEVAEGNPGDSVGIKVPDRVRRGDRVLKAVG
jgi:translation elongation factor EF-1alpha